MIKSSKWKKVKKIVSEKKWKLVREKSEKKISEKISKWKKLICEKVKISKWKTSEKN